jgi:hypothetical protein
MCNFLINLFFYITEKKLTAGMTGVELFIAKGLPKDCLALSL